MRGAMAGRLATGAVGVVMLGYGAWHLLDDQDLGRKASIGKWLLGGVIGHDGILAPVVFAGCALAWRLTGARARRGLAAFLLVGGSVAIVALPSALRSGDNPNPTVTPLDYSRNLALVLGGLAVCVVLYVVGGHVMDRRRAGVVAELEPEPEVEPEPDVESEREVESESNPDVAVELEPEAEPVPVPEEAGETEEAEETEASEVAVEPPAPDGDSMTDRDGKLDGQG